MKKAIITGVTGQDGSYLAEFLLGMGPGWWLVVAVRGCVSVVGSLAAWFLVYQLPTAANGCRTASRNT